jgi:hypothetical protein
MQTQLWRPNVGIAELGEDNLSTSAMARCAVMSDDDRDELIGFVRREAELIFYGPL